MYGILLKVTRRYLDDAAYRALFRFDPLLERLILSECKYPSLLPIARVDVFYNEDTGDFKFCEFNTDGSSGMAEEMDIAKGLSKMYAFQKFSKDLNVKYYDLFGGLVDQFLKIYETYENKTDHPLIAIVDFLESSVSNEFDTFKQSFEARGTEAVIADIRSLKYHDKNLYYNGRKIDAVYRRAVTGEIMRKKESCPDFIQSVLDGEVCIIGHIRTQIAHVKVLFSILTSPETLAFLNEKEAEFVRQHIPFTTLLSSGNYDYGRVLQNKDDWVIKPSDLYASKNVSAGRAMTQAEWEEALKDGIQYDYLLQEYYQPYESENSYFHDNGSLVVDTFGNITGLYLYNGIFSGIFSRAGKHPVISSQHQGFSLGSMYTES
jgi:glutathionylspermidine synthase